MRNTDTPRVTYRERQDGSYDITVNNPDAPSLNIDRYPRHIQCAVEGNFHKTLTLEERRKLRSAEAIGEPAYTAVWDDLASKRAEQLMRKEPHHLQSLAKMENGRDASTGRHPPSYHEAELERRG